MVNKPAEAHSLHTSANNVPFCDHKNFAWTAGALACADYLLHRSRGRLRSTIVETYALERYAPSAVSTRIFSPSLMKGGTCTTSPVSVLAGLVTLEAVADFNPGSVSTTVSSTVCGSSMPTALPS